MKSDRIIICTFEKGLPSSFMDIQVHILVHLVNDIELVGVYSNRWMFFLIKIHEGTKCRAISTMNHLRDGGT